MKCPQCGTENPDGKKFCGDCGAVISEPPPPPPGQPVQVVYVQRSPSWTRSHWKGLASVVVAALLVLLGMGMVHTLPLSKIKVIITNEFPRPIRFNMTIDNETKALMTLQPGTTIVGVWPVSAGNHLLIVDSGYWEVRTTSTGDVYYTNYHPPDGAWDFAFEYSVGPLYTKNAFIQLTLPP